MLPNENYKDYLEFLKNNLYKILEGKEIDYECPFCEKVERIKILGENRAICLNCNNEFDVKIRLQID